MTAIACACGLFNADGSASEVSGNGVRCLAALVVHGSPRTSRVTIDTMAGPKVLDLVARNGDALTFRASMGQPEDIRLVDLDAAGESVRAVALSVGNPQCVLLDDPLDRAAIPQARARRWSTIPTFRTGPTCRS